MQPTSRSPRRRTEPRRAPLAVNRTIGGEHLTLALVEAQVGALFELLPIALLVTTAEGELLRANAQALDLFGATRAVAGTPVQSLLPFMDDLDTVVSIRGAIYASGRIRPIDVRLRHLSHAGEVLRLYVIHG